eukprot:5225632-Pyramimonas_sp.AAC.1
MPRPTGRRARRREARGARGALRAASTRAGARSNGRARSRARPFTPARACQSKTSSVVPFAFRRSRRARK